jgi:glycosyltransferase involved in cell wall biosynthesis
MKILIISAIKPYKGSGSGLTEYPYQLISHMKPLLSKNDLIDELYALEASKRNNIRGLITVNTSFKKRVAAIPKEIYDIIHITDHEIGFAAKILKKAGNYAKVVTTIHDLSRFETGLHSGIIQKAYNKLVKGSITDAIRYSDMILCNSTQTRNTIKERFSKVHNLKTVPHGIDDRFLKTTKVKKGRPKAEFIVGYIGALVYHKNVVFVLKTAEYLKNEKGYKFMVYGTGAKLQELMKFKKEHSLAIVKLMGYVPERDKIKVYGNFDTFVFPSMYEGFGQPILEAQARGLPVIIYKNGKIPKEVKRYCLEAESPKRAAQIIDALRVNGYNEKQRNKVRRYARTFTWGRTAKESFKVYEKLTSR